jgi:hypothetical protein
MSMTITSITGIVFWKTDFNYIKIFRYNLICNRLLKDIYLQFVGIEIFTALWI